ncbi:MAG: phosphoribosyltransferase, partial [Deltaproteobacteria bacterium]|nr:phosphoribosyltransferase [Deltaproteobacteria bacterium]
MAKIDANLARFVAEREGYLPPRPAVIDARFVDHSSSSPEIIQLKLDLMDSSLPRYPTPEQRERRLDSLYRIVPDWYHNAWREFHALGHAHGMRTVITIPEREDSSDVHRILHELHDSMRGAEYVDNFTRDRSNRNAFHNPFQGFLINDLFLLPLLVADSKAFAESLGFDGTHVLVQPALQLQELAKQYDTVIAITKGGLPDAYMAHLLGLDPMIWDLHAHERKKPVSRWVTPFDRTRIEGKRVLLLDKD